MTNSVRNKAVFSVLEVLPASLARKIEAIAASRVGGLDDIREIRVKLGGVAYAVFSSCTLKIAYRTDASEMSGIIRRITDGALYAHRDTIARGYVSMRGGIRVGVCAHARYDCGEVGVSDISALVFRIPSTECEIAEQLYEAYCRTSGGILIYSPPGVGKTTALRSLALSVSRRDERRIVVVDERSEFDRSDFENSSVDILSGFSRKRGIELAVRSLSAEILMVDELMGDECREVEYSFLSGIPVIATAHAGSLCELLEKRELSELISKGIFSTFIGIERIGGRYSVNVAEDLEGCLSI